MYDTRTPISFQFEQKPHVLIVQASYHDDVSELLHRGALQVLDRAGVTHETIDVPGALEIAAAIMYAVKSLDFDALRRRFDGFIALGCVVKGQTHHNVIVTQECSRALQEIALRYALAIGNGVVSCDTHEQAVVRAKLDGHDRGGAAAEACLRMIELKHLYKLSPKRRWVAAK